MIMMDQYNMDQYNKETSQIHAPADLIRRTKEAVRQEEQRLERERQQQSTVTQPKPFRGKAYRWVLPAAAAVFCVIMLNVSGMIVGRNIRGGSSGASMYIAPTADTSAATSGGNDMGVQFGTNDRAESAVAAADEPINKGGELDMVAETTEEAAEYEEAYDNAGYDGGQFDAEESFTETDSLADNSAENSISGKSEAKGTGSSYIDSIYGSNLWIEKVERIPAFYDNPDTECVTIQGVGLYVGKDYDEAWIAYAEIGSSMYVINSELSEAEIGREEFARAAYELLTETTGSGD